MLRSSSSRLRVRPLRVAPRTRRPEVVLVEPGAALRRRDNVVEVRGFHFAAGEADAAAVPIAGVDSEPERPIRGAKRRWPAVPGLRHQDHLPGPRTPVAELVRVTRPHSDVEDTIEVAKTDAKPCAVCLCCQQGVPVVFGALRHPSFFGPKGLPQASHTWFSGF